jgi:hypothetical protein
MGDAVTALTGAERQRRYREKRKKREGSGAGSGLQPDGSFVPEFPGQRPPFQPGHEMSVTHGARRESTVAELAGRYEAELLSHPDTPEWLRGSTRDLPAVRALCRAEAIVTLLWEWFTRQDVETALSEMTEGAETEVRPAPGAMTRTIRSRRVASVLDQIHKHETRAMHLRGRLGLDPLSRVRLGKAAGGPVFDLAAYWASDVGQQKARDTQ